MFVQIAIFWWSNYMTLYWCAFSLKRQRIRLWISNFHPLQVIWVCRHCKVAFFCWKLVAVGKQMHPQQQRFNVAKWFQSASPTLATTGLQIWWKNCILNLLKELWSPSVWILQLVLRSFLSVAKFRSGSNLVRRIIGWSNWCLLIQIWGKLCLGMTCLRRKCLSIKWSFRSCNHS